MSLLNIYDPHRGESLDTKTDPKAIGALLAARGIRFERWTAEEALPKEADDAAVLSAYAEPVARLLAESGFASVDVISLAPDHPNAAAMRQKFLDEHTHDEFEIRFFVEGSGQFYLRFEDAVYIVRCDQGDLISVPANQPHWFDMGPNPNFRCIRFFTTPAGWVAHHTGDDIAQRCPAFA